MSEREEKLRAFFANPTQELFDIGTEKASIENYANYWHSADVYFIVIVLKRIEDQKDNDLIKFFSIVDLMLVISRGLSVNSFAEKMLEEKESDETLWVDDKIFYDWQYIFDFSDEDDCKKIAFEKMLEIAKRVKSDPELWMRVYTSTDDEIVKKKIEEEVMENKATFEHWLYIYQNITGEKFIFDKLTDTAKTYDEWEQILFYGREAADPQIINLALSEIVKCLN